MPCIFQAGKADPQDYRHVIRLNCDWSIYATLIELVDVVQRLECYLQDRPSLVKLADDVAGRFLEAL